MENKVLLFDIQAFSVHDGPGCRTTVFFKGCPLRCRFCANPEGQEKKLTKLLMPKINQVSFGEQEARLCGYHLKIQELLAILKRDRSYWGEGGGVTFSGGEPLMQAKVFDEILTACQEEYFHTAIETSAFAEKKIFLQIMSKIDFAFIDLKQMDTFLHKKETKVGNEKILENIKALGKSNWQGRLVLRMPLIPRFNDSIDNIEQTAKFMYDERLEEINVLSFHRFGESKWRQCGKKYVYAQDKTQTIKEMRWIKEVFKTYKLKCYLGNEFLGE